MGNANVYAATKAFMDSFTTSMAVAGAEYNVRENAINPGLINTEGTVGMFDNKVDALLGFYEQIGLVKKPATAHELAEFVLHVASTRYVNGTKLVFDGGILAK